MKLSPSKLLDLLYPRRCALCDSLLKKDEPLICRDCARLVRFRNEKTCVKCGRPLEGRVAVSGSVRFREFIEEPAGSGSTRFGEYIEEPAGSGGSLQNISPRKDIPRDDICDECAERRLSHDECIAPFAYNGMIKDSLIRFKYHERAEYAGFFAEAVMHYGWEKIRQWGADALIPVPVHKSRLVKRGYNQAALIAKELSARTGIPVKEGLIMRRKKTEAQKELTFEGRRQNISDAFAYAGTGSAPGTVIIIDDIFTTGSTLGTIAEILKAHGAEKVYGICVSS